MDFLSRDRAAAGGRSAGAAERRRPGARRAEGDRKRPPGGGQRLDRRPRRPRRLSPRRSRARRSRSRPRATGPAWRRGRGASCCATRQLVYLGAIALVDRRCCSPPPMRYARGAGATPRDAGRSSRSSCCCRRATSRLRASSTRSSTSIGPKRLPRLDFSDGRSRRRPHDGHRPDDADQRGRRRRAARAPRGAGARQPRSVHPLRHPQRLRRHRPRPTRREDAAILERARDGRRGAQREVRRRTTPIGSSCFIATGSGTSASRRGLAGSGSAARSKSSTACCAAPPTRASRRRSATSSVLPSVRYCITLDSDTRLPRDAAKRLIGIIAHPLNRPRFDPRLGRVTAGYGILQPRVSVTMASAAGSLFARTYAGHTGVDPYTTAVSDVYQDLFGEGIFTGKGLYDVDAFSAALEGRVPENALLSHDLFEGLYARTALVTDIEVVDDYPSSVLAHARRQHRWVRGDWQILWWLFPVRAVAHRRDAQSSAAHRALEDPRQPPAQPACRRRRCCCSCSAGRFCRATRWRGRPSRWRRWRFPCVSRALEILRGPRRGQSWGVFLRTAIEDLKTAAARFGLQLAFLAHEASERLHAIGDHAGPPRRDAPPSARVGNGGRERRARRRASGCARSSAGMIASPLLALDHAGRGRGAAPGGAAGRRADPRALDRRAVDRLRAQPADRRYGARRCRRPTATYLHAGRAQDVGVLRHVRRAPRIISSRRTTSRSSPSSSIAHRTSPTNIGLGLLATLAAHDLGFIDDAELVRRIDATLTTIERLERYEGHLLNWYDTRTLAPLPPAYVSTVDSGNLAGALLTLSVGLRDIAPALAARADGALRRDELPVPVRSEAAAVRDRLPPARRRERRPARSVVLRPARVRSAAGQLHRDRQRRRAGDALVPPRPAGHERARRAGPALVERDDVRVPDAAARDAHRTRTRCSTNPAGWWSAGRWTTPPRAACRGAFRSRPTTSSIGTAPISTRRSASPGSA